MAFPQDNLGTVVQLKIDGTWTNVMRYDDDTKILNDSGVTISRGASGLQDKTPPGTCRWTWQDPNGIYNNENPRSPYFGKIPLNTPVRVYVPRSTPALLIIDSNDGSRAQTTDKAALDITGDMELRFDFEPRRATRWNSGANTSMFLASKYWASGNRSWYVRMGDPGQDGSLSKLALTWSSTGSNGFLATCTASLPTKGRIAVKITLDVDNGAAGSDVKFYTSTTGIDGTYTQLGATVTVASVTSIFNSTANVEIGTMNQGALDFATLASVENYFGRVYGFRMYNGIGGTLVADADFTAQTVGATSFADGLGNTWTTHGVAEITDADYRFHGEFSQPIIRAEKTDNGAGVKIEVDAEAGGLIRRFTTNAQPLRSPLYALLSTWEPNGWWAGEEDSGANTTTASNYVSGGIAADLTDITFPGFDSTLAGSAGVMELGGTGPIFTGTCKVVPATNETHFVGLFKFPSVPLSAQTLFSLYSQDGTIRRWDLVVTATTYTLNGYDSAGTLTINRAVAFGAGASPTDWIAWHLQLTNTAGTISIKHEWMSITSGAVWVDPAPGTYAGSNGIINKVVVQALTALADVRIAHLIASTQVGLVFYSGSDNNFAQNAAGFPGERADARFIRICGLLGITPIVFGQLNNSRQLGPQPIATGMDILYQSAEVDASVIAESIDQLALEYRGRRSLYNQYGMELLWSDLAEGLQKASDDVDVANDITLSRDNGGNARAVLEFGPKSIQAPPDGINPVQDGPSVNNYLDTELPFLVNWLLLRRTWPTSRYPVVKISMHRGRFLTSAALQLDATKTDIGEPVTITTLPNFLAPEPIYLMVKGVTEELHGHTRDITFAMIPFGPYQTSELVTTATDFYIFEASHDTIDGVVQTQVNTDFDDNDTSISVKTLSGPVLSTSITDVTIKIGGERMRVTNVSGSTSPQTLTVTRGLDGFTAAHSADDYVYIDLPLLARL